MKTALMEQVLGDDWQKLPAVIQQHYAITQGQQSVLAGEMEVDYPTFMLPLIWLIHLFGGLILWRGGAVQTRVQKTMQADGLHWQRSMSYADRKSDYFASKMHYVGKNELIENIGFGFGLRLLVEVKNGDLVYRSNGHCWQWGKFVLPIPDALLLGSAIISEHALSEAEFYLNFTITHPLWGETYRYRGNFHSVKTA